MRNSRVSMVVSTTLTITFTTLLEQKQMNELILSNHVQWNTCPLPINFFLREINKNASKSNYENKILKHEPSTGELICSLEKIASLRIYKNLRSL